MRKAKDNRVVDPETDVQEDGTILPPAQPLAQIVPKNRIHERKQGCYNCRRWSNGELAESHFQKLRQRDVRILLERGRTLEQAEKIVSALDRLIKPPKAGLCLAGGSEADLVMPTYLCEKWDGRVGVEGAYDKTPEELYDKMGEKV